MKTTTIQVLVATIALAMSAGCSAQVESTGEVQAEVHARTDSPVVCCDVQGKTTCAGESDLTVIEWDWRYYSNAPIPSGAVACGTDKNIECVVLAPIDGGVEQSAVGHCAPAPTR